MNTEVVGFPVKDLPDRYKIGRTILYERINALSLTLEKVSNRAYVDEEQLKLLDALDTHIKAGGITSNFLREHGLFSEQNEQVGVLTQKIRNLQRSGKPEQSEQISERWQITYALNAIANRLTDPLQPLKIQQEQLRMLAEIAEQGWLIPTSQMLQLLGISTRPVLRNGCFERKGFTFIRMGQNGREREWRVQKN